MHHQEFVYWLQGYFELRVERGVLTSGQLRTIRLHLDLVKEVDRGLGPFATWLESLLVLVESGEVPMDESVMDRLHAKLQSEFYHVIDPSYGRLDRAMLNDIHFGLHRPEKGGTP